MEGDCEGVGITLSRQVATIPVINSNPGESASFSNYYLSGSGPSRETGGALTVLGKGQRDQGHLPLTQQESEPRFLAMRLEELE